MVEIKNSTDNEIDIDFKNPAGFLGTDAEIHEAQFIVHFLSHALIFCVGTLIEAHVVLTPAICVFGERHKFKIFAGTHKFIEFAGIHRTVQHVCTHKGYNHTMRWKECSNANLALLVLNEQFSFHRLEPGADYIINRLRYATAPRSNRREANGHVTCHYFGWGSRRSGYLIPLFIDLRRVDVVLLPPEKCTKIWNHDDNFLCIQQSPCKTKSFGALCPDDVGTVIECSGYIRGMMISRLVDRPCGIGFLDLSKFNKFLTCGVDDAREIVDHDTYMSLDLNPTHIPRTPSVITVPSTTHEPYVTVQTSRNEDVNVLFTENELDDFTTTTEESGYVESFTEEPFTSEIFTKETTTEESLTLSNEVLTNDDNKYKTDESVTITEELFTTQSSSRLPVHYVGYEWKDLGFNKKKTINKFRPKSRYLNNNN